MTRNRIFIIVVAFFLLGFFIWWNIGTKAVNPIDKSKKIFVVRNGAGIKEIATNLKQADLIKDPIVFFLLVKYLGLDSKIQKGDFRLSSSMDAKTIAESLTHGSLDSWITLPEGKRSEEI